MSLFSKILGDPHKRELKRHWQVVDQINDLEEEIQALSDAELAAKTQEFRERLGYQGPDISFGQSYADDLDVLGESDRRAQDEFTSGRVDADSEDDIERELELRRGASASRSGRRTSTSCFPRRSRWSAKPRFARWGCATSTSSWSGASCSTRARSPR